MAVNEEIFLGSGATLAFVPENDLYIKKTTATGSVSTITLHGDMAHIRLIKNLYVGCTMDRYNSSNVLQESVTITANSGSATANATIDFTPAVTVASDDYFIIRAYGAPCFAPAISSKSTLNSDNFMGLVESASFPNVEVEMKQMNLQLGGTRNFTHQYKGMETASGGNINLVANHGLWLYYALGKCTATTIPGALTTAITSHAGIASGINTSGTDSNSLIHNDSSHIETGPIFYRSIGNEIVPPLLVSDRTHSDLIKIDALSSSDFTSNFITYTINEQNTSILPSFGLEYSMSKLENSDTYLTDIDSALTESHNFIRIARGNRVNTLTMTSNENEEVKFTLDLNTSAVTELDVDEEMYARRNVSDIENFINRSGAQAGHLEPFFFSDGTISIYGTQMLKITNFTLTINNNIQDKRFIGVSDKGIKKGFPSQRTYELSFTALVTDDQLYREYIKDTEITDTDITLQFDKDNGEQIKLEFQNYFTSSNTWTVPDDKGPITVDATIMPRQLKNNGCTIISHQALMG